MQYIGERRRLLRCGLCMAAVLTMLLCAAAVQTAGYVDNSAQASCVNTFDVGEAQETTTEPETSVPGGDIPATGGTAVLIGLAIVSIGASGAVLAFTRGGKKTGGHKPRS